MVTGMSTVTIRCPYCEWQEVIEVDETGPITLDMRTAHQHQIDAHPSEVAGA